MSSLRAGERGFSTIEAEGKEEGEDAPRERITAPHSSTTSVTSLTPNLAFSTLNHSFLSLSGSALLSSFSPAPGKGRVLAVLGDSPPAGTSTHGVVSTLLKLRRSSSREGVGLFPSTRVERGGERRRSGAAEEVSCRRVEVGRSRGIRGEVLVDALEEDGGLVELLRSLEDLPVKRERNDMLDRGEERVVERKGDQAVRREESQR